jgi:hypothetical protein
VPIKNERPTRATAIGRSLQIVKQRHALHALPVAQRLVASARHNHIGTAQSHQDRQLSRAQVLKISKRRDVSREHVCYVCGIIPMAPKLSGPKSRFFRGHAPRQAMRVKNGLPKRGKAPFAHGPHPREMAGKRAWNLGRTFAQIYDAGTADRIRTALRLGNRKTQDILRSSAALEGQRRAKLSEVAHQRIWAAISAARGAARKDGSGDSGAIAATSWFLSYMPWTTARLPASVAGASARGQGHAVRLRNREVRQEFRRALRVN